MKKTVFFLSLLLTAAVTAADIYVDMVSSSKKIKVNPGTKAAPTSYDAAIKKAQPGDTIYILPADGPIYGGLAVNNKSDITIDGMNNIFTGARSLRPGEWEEVSPGLFKKEASNVPNFIERIFFVHNDKAVRMGRFTKGGKMKNFAAVEALKPGEWTVVDASPEVKSQKNVKKNYEYYIRLAEGETDLTNWKEPVIQDGVSVRGNAKDLKFKNIIATHFKNDGFNIHGNGEDISFENVAAVECGDDGFSAHKDCVVKLKNFVGIGNSTGICHIQNVKSTHDNVYFEGNLGADFFMMPNASAKLTNAFGFIDSKQGIRLSSSGKVTMENCNFVASNPRTLFLFAGKKQGIYTFKKVLVNGFRKVGNFSGVIQEPSSEKLEKAIKDKKAELFAIFGGNLEKICR